MQSLLPPFFLWDRVCLMQTNMYINTHRRGKPRILHSLTFTCYNWVFTPKGAVPDSFLYKWEHLNLCCCGPSSELALTHICLSGYRRRWFLALLEKSGFAFRVKMCGGINIPWDVLSATDLNFTQWCPNMIFTVLGQFLDRKVNTGLLNAVDESRLSNIFIKLQFPPMMIFIFFLIFLSLCNASPKAQNLLNPSLHIQEQFTPICSHASISL